MAVILLFLVLLLLFLLRDLFDDTPLCAMHATDLGMHW